MSITIHPVEEFLFYSNAKFSLPIILSIYHQLSTVFQQRQQGFVTTADISQTVGYCGKGLSTQEIETYTTLFQDICFLTIYEDGTPSSTTGTSAALLQMKGEFVGPQDMLLLNHLVPYVQQHCRGKYSHPSIVTLQKDIELHMQGGSGNTATGTLTGNTGGGHYGGGNPNYHQQQHQQQHRLGAPRGGAISSVGSVGSGGAAGRGSYGPVYTPHTPHQPHPHHQHPQHQQAASSRGQPYSAYQQSIRQAVLATTTGAVTGNSGMGVPNPTATSSPNIPPPPPTTSPSALPYTPNPQFSGPGMGPGVSGGVGMGSYHPSANPSLPYYQPNPTPNIPYGQPPGGAPYGNTGNNTNNNNKRIATSFYRPSQLQQTQHLAPTPTPGGGIPGNVNSLPTSFTNNPYGGNGGISNSYPPREMTYAPVPVPSNPSYPHHPPSQHQSSLPYGPTSIYRPPGHMPTNPPLPHHHIQHQHQHQSHQSSSYQPSPPSYQQPQPQPRPVPPTLIVPYQPSPYYPVSSSSENMLLPPSSTSIHGDTYSFLPRTTTTTAGAGAFTGESNGTNGIGMHGDGGYFDAAGGMSLGDGVGMMGMGSSMGIGLGIGNIGSNLGNANVGVGVDTNTSNTNTSTNTLTWLPPPPGLSTTQTVTTNTNTNNTNTTASSPPH